MILLLGCLSFLLFRARRSEQRQLGSARAAALFFCRVPAAGGFHDGAAHHRAPTFPAPRAAARAGRFFWALCSSSCSSTPSFFALPFQQTYLEEAAERRAYDRGVYALCRHPGVLWFILFYLCCWLARGSDALFLGVGPLQPAQRGIYRAAGPLHLPAHLRQLRRIPEDHPPFLIPNRASMRRCAATIKAGEEHGREL